MPARLPFAESVCLTLISQKVSHGWALGSILAPDGELGRIWTLTRPLTYRAIDGLVDKELITRTGQAAGRGRDRVILAATPAGRRLAKQWLDTPVEHLRDVRTELLVKLFLRERVGLANEGLLATQQQLFAPTIDALTSTSAEDDLVDVWRRESARAVSRTVSRARWLSISPPEGMTTPIAPTASPVESKTGLASALSSITASSASVAIPLDRTWSSCSRKASGEVMVSPVMLRSPPEVRTRFSSSGRNASMAFPRALAWTGMTMPTSGIWRLPSGRGS